MSVDSCIITEGYSIVNSYFYESRYILSILYNGFLGLPEFADGIL